VAQNQSTRNQEIAEEFDPSSNMTIVTAYFNLGSFKKGGGGMVFNPSVYFKWAAVFKFILNSIVIYTDSEEFENLIYKCRTGMSNTTKVLRIQRNSTWAFQLVDQIRMIYSQSGYPKHFPNTVVPEYSCAQHAKYSVVTDAIHKNYFNSKYYAWLDIGYFRKIVSSRKYFRLHTPPKFDPRKVAVTKISDQNMNNSFKSIFHGNMVWVGGGLFVGTADVLLQFGQQYEKAVHYFLNLKLMDADQQVIYGMYSVAGRKFLNPSVELQLYTPPKGMASDSRWFHLG
jgi:hypothetical protein